MSVIYSIARDVETYIRSIKVGEDAMKFRAQREFRQAVRKAPIIDVEAREFLDKLSGHRYITQETTSRRELAQAIVSIARNDFGSEDEKRELLRLKSSLLRLLSSHN